MRLSLPTRLASQLVLLLLITLAVAQILTLAFFLSKDDHFQARINKHLLVNRFAETANMLEEVPSSFHKSIVRSINTYRVKYKITNESHVKSADALPQNAKKVLALKTQLTQQYSDILIHVYSPFTNRGLSIIQYSLQNVAHLLFGSKKPLVKDKFMVVSARLANNNWLNMTIYSRDKLPIWALTAMVSLPLMSITLIIIVVTVVQRITRPLKQLADKAKTLGQGDNVEPISAAGPDDIKDAITAFNAMQARLNDVLVHRTRSLAAMSHDLRTPLASLRIHAEFITETDTKEKIIEKIDEMEAIARSTINFAKQDSWSEKPRMVDLNSLIESICLDFQDINCAVNYEHQGPLHYLCRPVALKRAFTNLIDNGVKYGNQVMVKVSDTPDHIVINIADKGIGIPIEEQNRVFQAFERLVDARSPDSGGIGLGMTIALSVVQVHGGKITLVNRQPEGLDVIVKLPK